MSKFDQLHWPLILGMGALALIRPVLNITGLMEGLGRPIGPLLITLLISLAWLAIVVCNKVRYPFPTLILTGVAYGVFAILLSATLSPMLQGKLLGPLTTLYATVSVLVTNAIWGGVVGLVALVLLKTMNPTNA
ncbi:MAG: hypothetical protein R3C14_10465 [Caldilineaceae bacterium]